MNGFWIFPEFGNLNKTARYIYVQGFFKPLGVESEKEMATHSSVLSWGIPGTGEPGRLPSMGSHRVGHDQSDLAAAAGVE